MGPVENGTEWYQETFDKLSLGELEDTRFEECTFVGSAWAEATLRRCVFEDCVVRDGDLSMVRLPETRLRGVRFERCKLVGVDFTAAYALGFDVAFESCVLSYASFVGLALEGLAVRDCKANEALFDDADLRNASFEGTDLSGARFAKADLRGADLSEATGYVIDPGDTKVKGAKMSMEGALALARALGIEC